MTENSLRFLEDFWIFILFSTRGILRISAVHVGFDLLIRRLFKHIVLTSDNVASN